MRADEYLTDDYIQHNPNVGSGREAFVEAFRAVLKRKDVADRVAAPLIGVVAEGDLVVFAIERRIDDQRGSLRLHEALEAIANRKSGHHCLTT